MAKRGKFHSSVVTSEFTHFKDERQGDKMTFPKKQKDAIRRRRITRER